MNVLVVGGGGREHTLAWKIARDSNRPNVFCAPGNAGTAECAVNVPVGAEDVAGIAGWARKNRPDLVVVGPEAPLCAGLADVLARDGIRVFGPAQDAAQMEGSKVFAKDVMIAAGVPTAAHATFTDLAAALAHVRKVGAPLVVKAEGLAAGKGVFVCFTAAEAEAAVREVLEKKTFGDAGARLVAEEYLDGEEASMLALVDGRNVVMLSSAQDHKRVFDNDQGPNTGGMGAYSPAPVVTEKLLPVIREEVFERTLWGLRKRGITYKGVLYAGLMVTKSGPKVLEFNCRFGDPETQVIVPRIAGDLVPVLNACIDGTLTADMVTWRPDECACVVMAAGGYPGSYAKGAEITGLDAARAMKDVVVFHAGTKQDGGRVVTAGGRVLGVSALGPTLESAVKRAYDAVGVIGFAGAHWRRDIAARALKHR